MGSTFPLRVAAQKCKKQPHAVDVVLLIKEPSFRSSARMPMGLRGYRMLRDPRRIRRVASLRGRVGPDALTQWVVQFDCALRTVAATYNKSQFAL